MHFLTVKQLWPDRQDTCDCVLYYFGNYLYCTILPLPCITKSLPWVAECFKGALTCMASVDIACGGYIRIMDQWFCVFWCWFFSLFFLLKWSHVACSQNRSTVLSPVQWRMSKEAGGDSEHRQRCCRLLWVIHTMCWPGPA